MVLYPLERHWIEVSEVTPLAAVFGSHWRELPVPDRRDVRWRSVFGYSGLATRVIHYGVTQTEMHRLPTLGALADLLVAAYTADQRFGRGMGVLGTAYWLTALAITPPRRRRPRRRPPLCGKPPRGNCGSSRPASRKASRRRTCWHCSNFSTP